ncbi:MAG: hypothetical protein ACKOZW_10235 [Cyanobium sp.]
MEVLVGVFILTTALAMAGAMNGVATRGLRTSTILNDRNAAVDADIATARSMAERYTWCSGTPALQASAVATCLATSPADESYFSPAVSQNDALVFEDVGNPTYARFQQACQAGTLTTDLINRINALPPLSGMSRNATAISGGAVSTHRIQILYEPAPGDATPTVRSVVITPPVAAFCP